MSSGLRNAGIKIGAVNHEDDVEMADWLDDQMRRIETKAEGQMNKPVVKLVGTDGNVFSIINKVKRSLIKAGKEDEAKKFCDEAFSSKSYDDVLILAMKYCEVE